MGTPVARLGDKGVGRCCCHHDPKCRDRVGTIIGGSVNVLTNGLSTARMTDYLIASCGHVGMIIGGSTKTLTNGLSTARLGDSFSGCFTGTIIGGSANVNG